MALAQKRVGVVVVDMQSPAPGSRKMIFRQDCTVLERLGPHPSPQEVKRWVDAALRPRDDGFFSCPGGRPFDEFMKGRNLPPKEAERLGRFLHSGRYELVLNDALGQELVVWREDDSVGKTLKVRYPDECERRVYSRVETLLAEDKEAEGLIQGLLF